MSIFSGGAQASNGICLVVDDVVYSGWISAEIERCLDEFAPRFSLRYIDRWAPDQKPWPIRKGALCRLLFDDELLIDGAVNRARFHANGTAWELSCEGRSITGDLADSSATHKTGHWQNATATKIAKDLLAPYGLTVKGPIPDLDVYPRFALEQGETVHAALDRLCKVRALLPFTHPDNTVELLSILPSGVGIELETRTAIERTLEESDEDQHSDYLLSAVGVGTPEEAFTHAAVSDLTIKRYRPLVVIGDAPANTKQAKLRAQWEANLRAGRGERLRYTMPGALSSTGDTYQPGQRFKVADDLLGVDETMIVSRAVLRASEKELVTEIELVRPETYSQFAYPTKKLTGTTKRGKPISHKTGRL